MIRIEWITPECPAMTFNVFERIVLMLMTKIGIATFTWHKSGLLLFCNKVIYSFMTGKSEKRIQIYDFKYTAELKEA